MSDLRLATVEKTDTFRPGNKSLLSGWDLVYLQPILSHRRNDIF